MAEGIRGNLALTLLLAAYPDGPTPPLFPLQSSRISHGYPASARTIAVNDKHIAELDGVRGIACLFVVVHHCLIGIVSPGFSSLAPYLRHFDTLLVGGVDLFFVLSGFLIGGILLDNRSAANFFGAFWARRACRILPVYWLLLSTYVAALSLGPLFNAPWLDKWLLNDPLPLWSYLTFTQNYVMALPPANNGALWLGITWSLAVEEQFYLLFPVLVYVLRRRTLVAIAIGCLVTAPIIRVVLWKAGGAFYSGYFPTPARMDALMFGFLVACVIRHAPSLDVARKYRIPLDVIALGIFVTILDQHIMSIAPTLAFTLLSAMFAYGVLRIFIADEGPYKVGLRSWFLVNAGLISYAWYMYHQAINGLVHGLLFQSAPFVSSVGQLAASGLVLIVSACLAAISTRYFERPFRQWGRLVPYRYSSHAT